MNISLTPQLEAYIQQKVATGHYNNASEVVREALRVLIAREQELNAEQAAKLAWLRQAIREGEEGPDEPLEDLETLLRMARAERDARRAAQPER